MRRMPGLFRWRIVAVLPAAFFLALCAFGDSVAIGVQDDVLRVERSDRLVLRFSYTSDGELTWRRHSPGGSGDVLHEPVLAGFVNRGVARKPVLPHHGGWVLVPPGTRPILSIVREDWQRVEPKRLLVGATTIRIVDDETGEVFPGEELLLPGQKARRGEPVEVPADGRRLSAGASLDDAVVLGQTALWRGRTVVSLSLCPLRCDGEGVATSRLHEGSWEIRFVPDKGASPGASQSHKITTRGDTNFAFLFLNGSEAMGWLTEAAAAGPEAAQTTAAARFRLDDGNPLMAGEIRIPITRTRLCRVTASELIDAQLLPASGISGSDIRLFQRRYSVGTDTLKVEVPIHMVGDGGDFTGSDFFVFYALRLRDDSAFTGPDGEVPGCADPGEHFNDANIYWLVASEPAEGQSWARMDVATVPEALGVPESSFRRTEYFEEARSYRQQARVHGEDRNMYNAFVDRDVVVPTLPIYAPDPDALAACQLTLGTVGFSTMADGDRFINAYLEMETGGLPTSHLIATFNANSLLFADHSYDFPAAWMADVPISLHLSRENNLSLFAYLDYVQVAYDALYEVVEGTYFFRRGSNFHCGDAGGLRNIEVTGFDSGDIGLIDLTEPHLPVWIDLEPDNIQGTTLSLSVMQSEPVTTPRAFAAFSDPAGEGIYPVSYGRLDLVEIGPDPRSLGGPVDLLVLTHGDFRQTLDRWVQHRENRSGGQLLVRVVDVQDIYTWFGGGLKSAEIIKRMVVWAHDNWGTWALQIVGDANENVRNLGSLNVSPTWDNSSEDWVPTYLYAATNIVGGTPEVLGSDKWYTVPGVWDLVPTSMYVGRFPCHSVSDLEGMIDKVIAMETLNPGQEWRRRGVFCADDRWSSGYSGGEPSQTDLEYSYGESAFQTTETTVGEYWESAGGVGLQARDFFLREYLCPQYNDCPVGSDTLVTRDIVEVMTFVENSLTPVLLSMLQEGNLLFRYQGHGNWSVMAHENIFIDRPYMRRDVLSLTNADKPSVFIGFGCHLAEWMRNSNDYPSAVMEPCLGEKLVLHRGGGASAAYASCGYEQISNNAALAVTMMRRWCINPPVGSVSGDAVRSRWVLGELVWAAEADYATWGSHALLSYVLLGDALMVLDAGPVQVDAVLSDAGDQPISEGDELQALDATNLRSVRLEAADEAGVAGISIMDSEGDEVSVALVETLPEGEIDHQQVTWEFDLPIRPFDHEVAIHVYDSAWAESADHHFVLTVSLPQVLTLFSRGEAVSEGEYEFPNSSAQEFVMQVECVAWLDEDVIDVVDLTGTDNLDIEVTSLQRIDEHHLEIDFTAAGTDAGECSLDLVIGGFPPTRFLLTDGGVVSDDDFTISLVNAFPNPLSDGTRFVFQTSLGTADGRIVIYSVAGRLVAVLPVRADVGSSGGVVVPWDGRDDENDELANGIYLYRVELDGPAGTVRSDMQRLVVMH